MDFEKTKQLAQEAAESDFLWELGMRAPSANQVRQFCSAWLVPLADEKRIKAVMRLRDGNPDALFEIRPNTAYGGEKTMVETITGPDQLARVARQKDSDLWAKITGELGIRPLRELQNEMYKFKTPVTAQNTPYEEREMARKEWERLRKAAEAKLPKVAMCPYSSSSGPYFVSGLWLGSLMRDDMSGFLLHAADDSLRGGVIRTYPAFVSQPYGIWSDEKNALPHFYIDARLSPIPTQVPYRGDTHDIPLSNSEWIRDVRWADAVISVKNRRFHQIAQKLAAAYEAETRRRRKPAKAVVLKNY